MATVTPKLFVTGSQLTTSAAVYYTASNVKAIVVKATAYNADVSAQTITVHIVASGGSASASNRIIEAKTIQPSGTVTLSELEGHVIPKGSGIYMLASAATSIAPTISGYEFT
jgi:hypothetical protein